jgi:hypothetical protein
MFSINISFSSISFFEHHKTKKLVPTSEPAVEISAKGRNEPMVQNLPERHLGR